MSFHYGNYYVGPVPEIFKLADDIMERRDGRPPTINISREVSPPDIKINYGAEGPLKVTEEWYVKHKQKKMEQQMMDRRGAEIKTMHLIAKKEMIRRKLGELDPGKAKDSKKIVQYNCDLKNIDMEIRSYQYIYKIDPIEIEYGTRTDRFIGRVKQTVHKVVKKVKKFCRRNAEILVGVASVILPIIGGTIMRRILRV